MTEYYIRRVYVIKGNSVKIIFPDLKDDKPLAQNIPLEIVYEDEYLIVLNNGIM